MNKAILVIDMPSCCYECFAFDNSCDHPMCLATEEIRGYTFKSREHKMDKCPIKPVPDKMYESGTWTVDGYVEDGYSNGWNACIEEILD